MAAKSLNIKRSGLDHHKRIGKELIPPFRQLAPPTEQIFWARDLLPEFLWIDALVQEFGKWGAVRVFNEFLTKADKFNSDQKRILDGTISAFRLIPSDQRGEFAESLADDIDRVVAKPLAHLFALYDDCPMRWMVCGTREVLIGRDVEEVRSGVIRLYPGKDPHTAFCRALPLNRFFAHKKIQIFNTLTETIEAIKQYPHGDRDRAETFARTTHNMILTQMAEEDPDTFAWARYFWNQNREFTRCIIE